MPEEPTEQAVEISGYLDYVPYIKELVQQRRKAGNFSFRAFCKKSGFKSEILALKCFD